MDPRTLEIYPGDDRSFTLYEDDGETTVRTASFRVFERCAKRLVA